MGLPGAEGMGCGKGSVASTEGAERGWCGNDLCMRK
jgi:hypothetical protein